MLSNKNPKPLVFRRIGDNNPHNLINVEELKALYCQATHIKDSRKINATLYEAFGVKNLKPSTTLSWLAKRQSFFARFSKEVEYLELAKSQYDIRICRALGVEATPEEIVCWKTVGDIYEHVAKKRHEWFDLFGAFEVAHPKEPTATARTGKKIAQPLLFSFLKDEAGPPHDEELNHLHSSAQEAKDILMINEILESVFGCKKPSASTSLASLVRHQSLFNYIFDRTGHTFSAYKRSLSFKINERFHWQASAEEAKQWKTVGDLYAFIRAHRMERDDPFNQTQMRSFIV